MIYIGADHKGHKLKEILKIYLESLNYVCEDLGAKELTPDDDYPDYALTVAQKVARLVSESERAENPKENRGVLLCGAGVGVDIVANKIKGIRSALCFDVEQARLSRNDDDTNILSLAADFISEDLAKEIVKTWLETPFSGDDRHVRRVEKISKVDKL